VNWFMVYNAGGIVLIYVLVELYQSGPWFYHTFHHWLPTFLGGKGHVQRASHKKLEGFISNRQNRVRKKVVLSDMTSMEARLMAAIQKQQLQQPSGPPNIVSGGGLSSNGSGGSGSGGGGGSGGMASVVGATQMRSRQERTVTAPKGVVRAKIAVPKAVGAEGGDAGDSSHWSLLASSAEVGESMQCANVEAAVHISERSDADAQRIQKFRDATAAAAADPL
jgi:hypothetical protein